MPVNFLNNILLPDNARLAFGDSWDGTNADLDIYHDGTDSYIADSGTGDLKLLGTNLRLKNAADSSTFLEALSGSTVSIYHNGSKKFSTSSTGIDITGGFTTTASSDCAGLNMTSNIAMGSNDITDSNSSAGSAGQVLSSLGAGNGVDWVDATTGDITGVTAGSGLTGGGTSGSVTISAKYSGAANIVSAATDGTGDTLADLDNFLWNDATIGQGVKYANLSQLKTYIDAGSGTVTSITATTDGAALTASNTVTTSGTLTLPWAGSSSQYVRGDGALATYDEGTVTSVAVSAGTGISISGSPITSSGTITVTNTAPNVAETFTEWIVRDDDGDDKTLSGSTNKYLKFEAATGTLGTNLSGTGTTGDPYVMTITSPDSDSGGTVTSIATTSPIEGGTITGSGTISHASFTDTETTSSETLTSADTFTAYTSVSTNATGHVTGHNLKTYTLPTSVTSSGVTSITFTSDSGSTSAVTSTGTIDIEGGTNVTTSATGSTVTINSTDQYTGTVTSVATSSPITGGTITGSGTIGISNATGTTVGAAAIQAGTGISVSDSSGVYTITNSSPSSGGTVTSVAITVGTGLDVSGSPITGSGTIDIDLDLTELTLGAGIDSTATGLSLDLSEFTDMTATMTGSDEFIVLDASAQRRKAASEIGLSIFSNDSGFTTNTGTVTSVSASHAGDAFSVSGVPITGSGTIAIAVDGTSSQYINGEGDLVALSTLPQGTVTSVGITAGTGISVSGSPVTGSGSITVTNSAPAYGWVIRDDDGDDKTLSGNTNKYLQVTMADGTAGTNLSGTGTTGDPYVLAITSPGDSGGTVTSVGFTHAGAAFSVAGQPVTSSGTIAVTMTGTSSQLVAGDGTLKNSADLPFVDGSGSANQVAYWSDSDTITGDADLTFDGTNLSIGDQMYAEGGNKGAPSYSFTGDSNTGMFSDTADQLEFAAGGNAGIMLTGSQLTLSTGVLAKSNIVLETSYVQLDTDLLSDGSGTIVKIGSGTTVAGKYYTLISSGGGTWEVAESETETYSTGMLGFALGTSPTTHGMLINGTLYDSGHGFTIGAPLYISETGGTVTNTAPTSSEAVVRVVGYAIDTDEIYFCPDNTWVYLS